jgi:acyl-CoA thioester hydrolase
MPAVFEHLHTVADSEIDQLGHVNNLAYLGWMQAAALAHSAMQGWPSARYRDLGAGWVVRAHQIKYLQSAYAGQEIVVRTWVADMNRVSSRRKFKMIRRADGATLAAAETQWAFVNYATGTLARVPMEVAEAFEIVARPDEPLSRR